MMEMNTEELQSYNTVIELSKRMYKLCEGRSCDLEFVITEQRKILQQLLLKVNAKNRLSNGAYNFEIHTNETKKVSKRARNFWEAH